MNWPYVGFHLCVQFALMLLVLVSVKLLQTFVIDGLFSGVIVPSFASSVTVETDATMFDRVQNGTDDLVMNGTAGATGFENFTMMLVPPQVKQYFDASSFVLWMLMAFGSSFILHLPSMWIKRVQLFRPARPLDPEWYPRLKKPFWHPPNIFFPMLWIPVRMSRSLGTSMLWESVNRNVFAPPILLALISIVLADIWNQVFFVQHDMLGGFGIMVTLAALEATYAVLLASYAPGTERFIFAGIFSDLFAACINLSIYRLNRKAPARSSVAPTDTSRRAVAPATTPSNNDAVAAANFKSD